MPNKKTKLPDLKKMSDMEIAKFWDEHDASEFWPEMKEENNVHCNIKNCTGEYEEGTITHTVRKQGQVMKTSARPDATVPLYEYKAS